MGKSNFLLVDLNETKTKKLANTITSDTSRKILNYLADKDDTEQNIAKSLKIPISTVHYHLQKLQEASLVAVEEFHYSKKGREVNHYKLANKYIIIAPKKVSGLKQKLRGILPAALGILGISAIIKLVERFTIPHMAPVTEDMARVALEESVIEAAPIATTSSSPFASQAMNPVTTSSPDIALWFLIGGLSAILIYIVYQFIKEKLQ